MVQFLEIARLILVDNKDLLEKDFETYSENLIIS